MGHASHGRAYHLRVFLARRNGWRESLYRHQRCFEASDCGPLGRQAANHPWSALRVVKSCRKDCPTASVLLEAKAAALYPERYQSPLSKLSTKEGGRGGEKKRRESDWLANQVDRKVMDRQVIDRQVETRPMSAGTHAERAASKIVALGPYDDD